MNDKKTDNYCTLLDILHCKPEEYLMVGNSVKSDILPILEIGSKAIHIPFKVTWQHETHDDEVDHSNFTELNHIGELPDLFNFMK